MTAELANNVATVSVDGREMNVGVSSDVQSQPLNTYHELYIGGLPSKLFQVVLDGPTSRSLVLTSFA